MKIKLMSVLFAATINTTFVEPVQAEEAPVLGTFTLVLLLQCK